MNKNEEKNEEKKEEKRNMVIKLSEPYSFEGKTYEEIDLGGLLELSGRQLIEIEKKIRVMGVHNSDPETAPEGAFVYATYATNLPIEFFYGLPLKDARRIKVRIINFLWY